jgi:excinuclease ABC subunit C
VPSDRARYFGPYLGGLKVRLAVSALHRVTRLTYMSDRLSGCERDMARVLGVRRDDLVGLVRMVNAVLDRRPKAVRWLRGELIRRRDSAAQTGAFELAARLQAEIEAVDWVISEQKVALCDSGDFDIHGWADGLLVRFQVRRGRLCAWEEQTCTEVVARPRVAATPGPWTEFAHRNAQLAARLRGTPARPGLGP